MRFLRIMAVAAVAMFAVASSAEARSHHYHHYRHHQHHSRGSCDGIHRCTCGSTQTRYFGLPRIVRGHNLWQAAEWPRAFPRTDAHAGVVMYQHGGGPTGHVSRLVQLISACLALVADDKGQYERNICSRGAIFVQPHS